MLHMHEKYHYNAIQKKYYGDVCDSGGCIGNNISINTDSNIRKPSKYIVYVPWCIDSIIEILVWSIDELINIIDNIIVIISSL